MESEYQDLVRAVAGLVPDRAGARNAADGGPSLDAAAWEGFVELGLAAASLPEALGGSDVGLELECLILETLAANAGAVPAAGVFLAGRILGAGTGEAAADVARALVGGRRVVPLLSAESGAALDVSFDAGADSLSGVVTDAPDAADADILLVPTPRGWWAIEASGEDFQSAPIPTIDATRPLASVAFRKAAARHVSDMDPAAVLRLSWLYAAAEAVGAGATMLEMGRTYALDRKQFGEQIGRFQAIKHKLANGLVALEGARSALYGAVSTAMEGVPAARMAHMAKAVAPAAAVNLGLDMVQLHGAIANTWEHDIHLVLRRAKYLQLIGGSSGWHHGQLAASLLDSEETGKRDRHAWEGDLQLSDSDRAFIAEFRAWLDEHAPRDKVKEIRAGGRKARRAWQAELAEGGWAGIHWPREFGGRDATFTEQVLYHSELASRGFPGIIGNRGLSLIGPTLIAHGTPQQREWLLEASRRADILWASTWSEPNAGSDLASLRTRGVVDGDELVINGQKIWTSMADGAEMYFTLVRTGPLVPKHEGISVVVIPRDTPGVTIKPIRRIHGEAEFFEVFLDDVRVPLTNVIGAMGNGWRVMRTTLSYEHMTNFLGTQMRNSFLIERLIEQYRKLVQTESLLDPGLRSRLTQVWTNLQLLRLMGLRSITRISAGGEVGAEGSILKLFGQEEEQRLFELALDLKGTGALTAAREIRNFLSARAATVGGGTSEIHRNKIAERVMGMPRDPWADE